jgi:hypothetical protein
MVPPQEEFLDLYFLPCSRMELLESPTQLKYLLAIEPAARVSHDSQEDLVSPPIGDDRIASLVVF